MVAWIGADTLMSGISTETMRMVVAKRKGETKQTQKRVLQQTSAQVRALCASVNLSGKTINATTWRLFRRVYMMARNVWGVPLQQISWESLKVPETAPHFHEITVEEERQFAALRSFSTRYGPCFTFALKSGLGLQEIADLKWSQVDFERRAIWVSMRNGSIRRAAIDGAMMEILLNEFGKEPVHVFTLGEQGAGGKGNPNSSQGRRRPITIAGLRSWFARARTRLQLHVRARDLRYTGAMRLLSVTGNAGAARQFLGLTVPKREFAKLGRTCIPISEMIKLQDRVHSEIRRRSLSQDTSYRPTRGINFE
jgi:integrase